MVDATKESKPATPPTAVAFRCVSKRFGPVAAVDQVSFRVKAGSVHAILGENGAGKTTLMRLLSGILQPDSGQIELFGSTVSLSSPRQARYQGIGMVHQHLALLPALTVAENLLLDDDEASTLFSPAAYARSLAQHTSRFGVRIAADVPVWQLSTAQRQILEIARVLMKNSAILVLDEPTAHLSPIEGDRLLHQVSELAGEGRTVLLVTHKLREIKSFADEVTVLRKGRHVTTAHVDDLTTKELAEAMVGEDSRPAQSAMPGAKVFARHRILCAEDLGVRGSGGQLTASGLSFSVDRGEIVGIAGISGNGQEELASVLAGLAQPAEGSLSFCTPSRPTIAFIPADRVNIGAPRELTVAENLTLHDYLLPMYSSNGLLNFTALRRLAETRSERFQIQVADIDQPTAKLSGGNAQRVVLARELSRTFDLLVAQNPTSGLDVPGTAFVRTAIRSAAKAGAAVVLVSDDLDEILEMSDRILVLSRGRSEGPLETRTIDRTTVGRLLISDAVNLVPAGLK
jgi:simple sugar transport system ATP-binding protein